MPINTKTNNKISKENVKRKIFLLLGAGSQLSNIAYNCKQRSDVPEDIRKICCEVQERWDEAYRNLSKWMTKI